MKAIVYHQYGSPDVLKMENIEKPTPRDNEVLIKVRAVSLNSSDNEFLRGKPAYVRAWGLRKPKINILGSDLAGIVESVGKNVTLFKPGDEVFGDVFDSWGCLAEYVCAREDKIMHKPASMTFEQAAAIPQAAVVALQGLRYKREVQPGQKVLINGAGGGAGSFAIQLAKLFGAEVTAVDNTGKLDMMLSLGADHVIDYTKENYTRSEQQYNFILDFVGSHPVLNNKQVLTAKGIYAIVGGSVPRVLQVAIRGLWISIITGKKMGILMHKQNIKDMTYITELYEAGKVKPIIDKCYPLSETAEAFQHLGDRKAQGKVVVTI